jgi:hypothetical protein
MALLAAFVSAGWRRNGARHRLIAEALLDPRRRPEIVAELEEELSLHRHHPLHAYELRVALLPLYLADDRAEEALLLVEALGRPALQDVRLALLAIQVNARLRRWAEAMLVIMAYPPRLGLDQAPAWAEAHAQVLLGYGDYDGAQALLDNLPSLREHERAAVELTRLRLDAARGRDGESVWQRLAAQPRAALQLLARRHGQERAGQIARQILAGGAYR